MLLICQNWPESSLLLIWHSLSPRAHDWEVHKRHLWDPKLVSGTRWPRDPKVGLFHSMLLEPCLKGESACIQSWGCDGESVQLTHICSSERYVRVMVMGLSLFKPKVLWSWTIAIYPGNILDPFKMFTSMLAIFSFKYHRINYNIFQFSLDFCVII